MQTGNSRRRSPGISSLASSASRAAIQFRLPRMVLISPLWAMNRYGWASGQLRERVRREPGVHQRDGAVTRSSDRSGKNAVELVGRQHALVDDGAATTATGSTAPTPRSRVSRSACLRTQNITRSRSMPRSGRRPAVAAGEPAAQEDLPDPGHRGRARSRPGRVGVGRHVPPAEHLGRPRRARTSRDRDRPPASARPLGVVAPRSAGRPAPWRTARPAAAESPPPRAERRPAPGS